MRLHRWMVSGTINYIVKPEVHREVHGIMKWDSYNLRKMSLSP